MICYIVPWWPSWLSDQIAFSNPESDVVRRVSSLSPWPPPWILELNNKVSAQSDFFGRSFEEFQDGGSWKFEQNHFSNSEYA